MKHARKDYDRIQDPLNKIPEDEPVFLLRAKDALAPGILIEWANRLRAAGGDTKMAEMVENHAGLMLEYRSAHGFKIPDLPKDYFGSEGNIGE